jgi:hypothetical protein
MLPLLFELSLENEDPMKQLYYASALYTVLGLLGGMFYREYTKGRHFDTGAHHTELAVVHTHLLSLGTTFLLIVLALEKTLQLSRSKLYPWFFWVYNVGVLWASAFMMVIGMRQVQGHGDDSPALDGIAGLGHIVLTIGFVLFFIVLYPAVSGRRTAESREPVAA